PARRRRPLSTLPFPYTTLFRSDQAVDFLADLAGDGAALELGIGTGRLALPFSRRGVRVHGIDLSDAMVARLRSKPGADAIGVTIDRKSTRLNSSHQIISYAVVC